MSVYDQQIISATLGLRANAAGWVRFNCPACIDRIGKIDRNRSSGLNTHTGGYHCFRCKLVGYLSGVGAGPEGAFLQRSELGGWEPTEPPPGYVPLGEGVGRHAVRYRAARLYLTQRHVHPDVWYPNDIGTCDLAAVDSIDPEVIKIARRMNGRIIVPVRELDGRWRGYVGRAYYKPKPGRPFRSYLNHAGNWRESTVWNLPALFVDTDVPVLVTEGLFDALPLYPNSVALLGKPTHHQEALLLKAVRPVCMLLDGDAWRLSKATALKLHVHGQRVGFVKLPPARDPNDLDPAQLLERAIQSVQSTKWMLEM